MEKLVFKDAKLSLQSGMSACELLREDGLAGKPLALELENVRDVGMARIKLNGTDLGIVWRPLFRMNLGKSLKSGDNNLDIIVVNSWRNHLIADASLPADKRLTKTNAHIITNSPAKWQLVSSACSAR